MPIKFPKIHIRSKREFARHISHKNFSPAQALVLINDVKANSSTYWKDNKYHSEPAKDKYVRSAKGRPLGKLLEYINERVLGAYDNLLPAFVFGGIKESDHVKAAAHLLGGRKKRTLLAMDIKSFFEQIHHDRVFHFFYKKCACDKRIAKLFADLSCVPVGPKDNPGNELVVARGFATSSRLAVWTNVELFDRMTNLVKKRLKNHDPRIAIYVDDIGITASRVTRKQMEDLRDEIMKLFLEFDENQPLHIHPISKTKKNRIVEHQEGIEHLGLRLYRNRLGLGAKTVSKKAKHKNNRFSLV
ncbi:MAG: reverse transcriptase domain-containing protein, partial [Candidatus Magasanikbacteria bacterium]|nr:reverse transcriptase domain-containing protein [Candidatus Magasanikbacteria bacterium]